MRDTKDIFGKKNFQRWLYVYLIALMHIIEPLCYDLDMEYPCGKSTIKPTGYLCKPTE
jgi:hypothetical protein